MNNRQRVIDMLLKILGSPYQYTQKDLALLYNKSKDTIREDLKAIEAIGIHKEFDKPYYRIALLPDRRFKELSYLQPLTETERGRLSRLINDNFGSSKEAMYLNKKLESLYDFQKLGLRALRKPNLEKIDQLESAKNKQQQVVLKNYRSNSNTLSDRNIEAFHIEPELDTIQGL